MKIADEFMVMRRSLNLSQESIAAALGISRNTVCNWECGKTTLPAWAWRDLQNLVRGKTLIDAGVDVSKTVDIDEDKLRALHERLLNASKGATLA